MSQFPLAALASQGAVTIALNNLASGASVRSTAPLDNTTVTTRFDNIVVSVTITSAAFTGTAIDGALIPSADATNYATVAGATFPVGSDGTPIAYCYVDSGTSAKLAVLVFRRILPIKYHLVLRNGLGAAFTAASNVAAWYGTLRETR